MAITNAQQYQQLVNKPADGKRPGYAGRQDAESQYGGGSYDSSANQSGREQSFGGNNQDDARARQNDARARQKAADEKAARESAIAQEAANREAAKEAAREAAKKADDARLDYLSGAYQDQNYTTAQKAQYNKFIESQTKPQSNTLDQIINYINPLTKREQFYNLATNFLPGSKQSITNARQAYAEYLRQQGLTPSEELLDTEDLYDYFDTQAFEKNLKPVDAGMAAPMNYGDFIAEKFGLPGVKYSGDVGGLEMYVAERDPTTGKPTKYGYNERREGRRDEPILPLTPYQQDVAQQEVVDPNSIAGLIANRGLAYRFMADGGRAGFMGGGMPYEGGMMDLESARQMYGLGKLVKKATGAIKKIVKSPVGKAALLYGLGSYGLGKGLFGGIKGAGFLKGPAMKDFLFGGKDFALKNLTSKGVLAGIGGISALSGLMSQPEEDEEPYYRGPGLDIDAIRRDPYGTKGSAYGFYAEGGNVKEPVAKNTMRLLDMNGMEKDYRADGGFVPIGRMERADDVPARLSKNEFVFTADAVRNAGDGDIDKGAEVMYNMMKNLEAGGDISEESQGLNGAREMFQTSKRLEEVL
jgi:hypothetical protein